MVRILVGLFIFALAVYAVSDVIASNDQRRGGTPKFLWVLITLLIPILGPIIWIVFSGYNKGSVGGPARTKGSAGPSPYKPRPRPSSNGSLAPDDDPDFLWKLEAEQRRKANEERRKAEQEKDSKPTDDSNPTSDSDDESSTDS